MAQLTIRNLEKVYSGTIKALHGILTRLSRAWSSYW